MNKKNFNLSIPIISKSYVEQAEQARNSREKLITALLSNVRLFSDVLCS